MCFGAFDFLAPESCASSSCFLCVSASEVLCGESSSAARIEVLEFVFEPMTTLACRVIQDAQASMQDLRW